MNAGKIFIFALLLTVVVAIFADQFSLTGDTIPARKNQEKEQSPLYRMSQGQLPGSQASGGRVTVGEFHIPRGQGGHYWTEGEVDGTSMAFVVDTGASYISLSYEDAERAGLDPDNLEYDGKVNTANGVARIAHVTLSSFRLGGYEVYDVEAIVSSPGSLPVSLLGMSFLNRLASFQVEGENLVLRF